MTLQSLFSDLRFSARTLSRAPLFTAVAVVSLALGIGANAAILSMFDQIMLRMLPVRDPQSLVILRSPGDRQGNHFSDDNRGTAWSYPLYRELRDRNQVFDGLLARFGYGFSLAHQGSTERVSGELISGNYFDVLGVRPAMGRLFTRDDDLAPGAHPVAVISHSYWQRRFALDPKILNQSIVISGYPMTLVGVAQQGFFGVQRGFQPDVWMPMAMKTNVWQNARPLESRNDHWLNIFGRLKSGVTATQAQASLAPLFRGLREAEAGGMNLPQRQRPRYIDAPLILDAGAQGRNNLQDETRQPMMVTLAIVTLVLLIACANVAGLLVARGAMRRKEVAVRLAIGASRGRLVQQLFAESLLIAGAAGALSILVSQATLKAIWLALPRGAQDLEPALDVRVLAVHFGIAFLTAVVFGLIPAFDATRTDLTSVLKDVAAGGARTRFRKVLVAGQVALTFVLLAVSGLLVRSLWNLRSAATGMQPQQVVRFDVAPGISGYNTERTRDFLSRLHQALSASPGVQAVSLATVPVFSGSNAGGSFTFEGYRAAEDEDTHLFLNWLGPGYFATLGIPLIAGREFDARDQANSGKVCLINESTARRYFKDRNPIGLKLVAGTGDVKPDTEIVGVVKDSKHDGMREELKRFVYFPYTQERRLSSATFYVRTRARAAIMPAVREQSRQLDGNVPLTGIRTLELQIADSLAPDRVLALIGACFALLAAMLAGVGVYGVMAFAVARRTREIGIRMALGAKAGDVRALVVREVALLSAAAVLTGIPVAWAIGQIARSMLFGVGSIHLPAVLAAVAGVAVLTLIASYVPARRATRIDPVRTLRHD